MDDEAPSGANGDEPPEPANRDAARKRAGELVHVDVKRLARIEPRATPPGHGTGRSQYKVGPQRLGDVVVDVCVDDATRLAYAEVLPDELGDSRWVPRAGGRLVRDAGDRRRACAQWQQRRLLPLAPARPGLPRARHAPPAHPPLPAPHQRQAERFIQTLTRRGPTSDCCYGSSHERTATLPGAADPRHLYPTTRLPRPPTARSPPRRAATTSR